MAIPVAIFDRDIMPNPEGLEKRDYGQCAIRSDGQYLEGETHHRVDDLNMVCNRCHLGSRAMPVPGCNNRSNVSKLRMITHYIHSSIR
jgi:hypothetical protein